MLYQFGPRQQPRTWAETLLLPKSKKKEEKKKPTAPRPPPLFCLCLCEFDCSQYLTEVESFFVLL